MLVAIESMMMRRTWSTFDALMNSDLHFNREAEAYQLLWRPSQGGEQYQSLPFSAGECHYGPCQQGDTSWQTSVSLLTAVEPVWSEMRIMPCKIKQYAYFAEGIILSLSSQKYVRFAFFAGIMSVLEI